MVWGETLLTRTDIVYAEVPVRSLKYSPEEAKQFVVAMPGLWTFGICQCLLRYTGRKEKF